ncbi:uncharacterized protein [Amphiura filiformis]|uniref:uncharacterized protein isoform X2 n=1 Tax=Amphiura filiformis TaxID=82378 RepID=UPI003B21499D
MIIAIQCMCIPFSWLSMLGVLFVPRLCKKLAHERSIQQGISSKNLNYKHTLKQSTCNRTAQLSLLRRMCSSTTEDTGFVKDKEDDGLKSTAGICYLSHHSLAAFIGLFKHTISENC